MSSSSPKDAAEYLLQTSIAPVGSGRVGTLLDAIEVQRGKGTVYQLEYRVERDTSKGLGPLRAMSVVAVTGGIESVGGSSSVGGDGGAGGIM